MARLRVLVDFAKPGDIWGNRYRLEQPLGEGGMGVVFAAEHIDLKEPVAIKILHPRRASDPAMVARFLREGRTAVKIRSEHVARVFDVGTEGSVPYLVMELLTGEDLAARLEREGGLPVVVAIDFVLQVCEALASAHGLGIVHRDLKPSNLFIAENPAGEPIVKVLDFGISKVPEQLEGPAATTTREVLGSPGYMSPEQMRATRDVDQRTDIWSLGVILWEMLAGRPMFGGVTFPELCAKVLGGNIPRVDAGGLELPSGLAEVVERTLAVDPNDRFASVAELAEALAPFGPSDASVRAARVARVSRVTTDRKNAPRSKSAPSGEPAVRTSRPGGDVPVFEVASTRTATPVGIAPTDPQTGEPSSLSARSRSLPTRSRRTVILIAGALALGVALVGLAIQRVPSPAAELPSAIPPPRGVDLSAPLPVDHVTVPSVPAATAPIESVPHASEVAPLAPVPRTAATPAPAASGKGGARPSVPIASTASVHAVPPAESGATPAPLASTHVLPPANGAPILR